MNLNKSGVLGIRTPFLRILQKLSTCLVQGFLTFRNKLTITLVNLKRMAYHYRVDYHHQVKGYHHQR